VRPTSPEYPKPARSLIGLTLGRTLFAALELLGKRRRATLRGRTAAPNRMATCVLSESSPEVDVLDFHEVPGRASTQRSYEFSAEESWTLPKLNELAACAPLKFPTSSFPAHLSSCALSTISLL
jgi:hypothetical protein